MSQRGGLCGTGRTNTPFAPPSAFAASQAYRNLQSRRQEIKPHELCGGASGCSKNLIRFVELQNDSRRAGTARGSRGQQNPSCPRPRIGRCIRHAIATPTNLASFFFEASEPPQSSSGLSETGRPACDRLHAGRKSKIKAPKWDGSPRAARTRSPRRWWPRRYRPQPRRPGSGRRPR